MGILGDVYENLVSSYFRRVTSDAHTGVLGDLPCSDVILPSVPRTGHHIVVKFPLAEWPPSMHADIVDCIELTGDIGERNRCSLDLKLVNRTRRHISNLGGARECHVCSYRKKTT